MIDKPQKDHKGVGHRMEAMYSARLDGKVFRVIAESAQGFFRNPVHILQFAHVVVMDRNKILRVLMPVLKLFA